MALPKNVFTAFCKEHGLFWQFPARTEEVAAGRVPEDAPYLPMAWATLIDKHVSWESVVPKLRSKILLCDPKPTETTCQHIFWKNLIPVFRELGVTVVYSPHKLAGEHFVNGIEIRACPLYAVNAEDPLFTLGLFDGMDTRHLLYSFVGTWAPHYISRIRLELFEMRHPADAVVKRTEKWHLEDLVYSKVQNADMKIPTDPLRDARTLEYNQILKQSFFSLCPSGAGPGTIRFWESLAVGSVPVVLSDGMCLPEDAMWEKAIVRVSEKDVCHIEHILRAKMQDHKEMSKLCKKLYHKHALRTTPYKSP